MQDLVGRTKGFAIQIIHLYGRLPQSIEAQVIGKQMLRSGTSVGAHYREAIRARSSQEYAAKVDGGLAELEEIRYWIELLVDSKIIPSEQTLDLFKEADELVKIFATISKLGIKKKLLNMITHPILDLLP